MESSKTILEIKNLSATAGEKQLLNDVSFSVKEGETHVIMGPNGAGKSTLGSVIMGNPAFEVTGGEILFKGQDMVELSPDKRSREGLFMSFQAPVEIPGVPITSFLRAICDGRENIDLKGKHFKKKLHALAEELDMNPDNFERELGVGFSGGEKKKLEMLQLLLLEPDVAILDETDSGLDVDALSVVSKGMETYRKNCNGTLIVITHNTRILEHLRVDKVHVLVQGRLVCTDDASLIGKIDSDGFERFACENIDCDKSDDCNLSVDSE